MSISDKDREFMEQVAAYFRSTAGGPDRSGSIRDTAIKFGINRNKVRKILITTGDITSPITEDALALKAQGMSVQTIAERLGVSTATVSTYLPYEDTIKGGLEPTPHAKAVRGYRAYEKEQAVRQVQRKMDGDREKREAQQADTSWKDEWKKDIKLSYTETDTRPQRMTWDDAAAVRDDFCFDGVREMLAEAEKIMAKKTESEKAELNALEKTKALNKKQAARMEELRTSYGTFPGALVSRRIEDLEAVSGDRIPFAPREVRRLHLELVSQTGAKRIDDETAEILKKYGGVKYGETISRDVVVPSDIPLYAIHYLIQRLFGWENSHLHKFELPEEVLMTVTENRIEVWTHLVGILFRSPYMSEDDEFWADDYEGGSFKNWLTKKYTGPYLSQCHGEGFVACQDDMQDDYKTIEGNREYYVLYTRYKSGEERVIEMSPVYDGRGKKNAPPTGSWAAGEKRVEIMKYGEAPIGGLQYERSCFDLLERLPLDTIMAVDARALSGGEMLTDLYWYINRVITSGIDAPNVQVYPEAFTDTLYYSYDFGDDWKIRITVMDECRDLVGQGRITQEQLDKAQIKCRELYRPVTLAVDGEMLLDDVGGIHGFTDFLQAINPDLADMDPGEKEAAKAEKNDTLAWAKGQNWRKLNPMI